MTDQFIAGFFSADGYFSKQVNSGRYYFSIGVKKKIESKQLLTDIKEYLEIGSITECNGYISYRITKRKELDVFIDRICPLLQGYKMVQFNNWIEELRSN